MYRAYQVPFGKTWGILVFLPKDKGGEERDLLRARRVADAKPNPNRGEAGAPFHLSF